MRVKQHIVAVVGMVGVGLLTAVLVTTKISDTAVAPATVWATTQASAAGGPSYVDITWMSVSSMYFEAGGEAGRVGIITDGWFSRIPQDAFYGDERSSGFAYTRRPYSPDVDAITRVLNALGPSKVDVLLTGHSHFDHSMDIPTWSRLTGARIIGARTTCYQAMAQNIPGERCTHVYGGEKIALLEHEGRSFMNMRVVRMNHSGDPARNPILHNPQELTAIPSVDPATGGLRLGISEDFPNGGGTRGFLFTVEGPRGRFSWFYQNSASAVDLHVPIRVDGVDYGAPIENLKAAMKDASLDSVDLAIVYDDMGSGGALLAQELLPVLKPKAYLPVHWDGLFGTFQGGVTRPYSNPGLEDLLAKSGVKLVRPAQYMDKWRLDPGGVQPLENSAIRRALGLPEVQSSLR